MRAPLVCLTLLLTLIVEVPTATRAAEPLRVVVPALPTELDPHKAVSPVDLATAGELFMGLVTRNAAGAIEPGVSDTWTISPDGLTYTFDLRYGAKWSDGRRVSADDFVAGLARALDPKTGAPYAGDLLVIQGAEGVRAGRLAPQALGTSSVPFRRLRINLTRPSAHFLNVLSRPVAAPIPRHAMKNDQRAWTAAGSMVSNGAFIAEVSGDGVALAKNPRFVDVRTVDINRVEFVVAESASIASRLVTDGFAHMTLGFPFEIESGPPPISAHIEEGQGVYFVAVNVRRPYLKNREVRHALAMTIDREALVLQIALAGVAPAFKMVPPDVLDETLSPRAPYAALNPNIRLPIAEVLLAETNISRAHPRAFKLVHPHGGIHDAVTQHLTQAWAQLGILVTAESKSNAEYDQILSSGAFDLALSYWRPGNGGLVGFLEPFTQTAGPLNTTGYAEPDFDQLLEAADASLDPLGRTLLLADAEGVLIQDQAILPIFFYTPRHVVAEHVRGWVANPHGIHPFRFLSLQ